MSDQANADQVEYWNSANGQTWVRHQEDLDKALENPGRRLLERAAIEKGQSVLDIGCGAGASTFAAAKRVGVTGRVLGLDISELLLARARDLNNFSNVEFLPADAQTHPLAPNSFDIIISRFGIMFFNDPVAAFANLRRALKSGGQLHGMAWASMEVNPWFKIPYDFAVALYGPPEPPSPRAPGPMAFQDPAYVEDILKGAGFKDFAVESEDLPLVYEGPVEEAAALASQVGPAARLTKAAGGGAQEIATIASQVAGAFEAFAEKRAVRVPARLNFLSAVNG